MDKNFINAEINSKKLIKYGFALENNIYSYSKAILDNQFTLTITIENNGKINTKLIDNLAQDEYILHKMEDVSGSFVNRIRNECNIILNDVLDKCFEKMIFKSKQCQDIIRYVKTKYDDDLEFLWKKSPNNAILRRQDNRKWYAVILSINYNKIDTNKSEQIEIVNLKADTKIIDKIIDNHTIFPGFHMNKKHWISIPLDYSMPNEKLFTQIDNSYILTQKISK